MIDDGNNSDGRSARRVKKRATGQIIPFKRRRGLGLGAPSWPPIMDPLRQREEEEDRVRMRQNLAAAVVLALLFLSGIWIIDELHASARMEACVEAAQRHCG